MDAPDPNPSSVPGARVPRPLAWLFAALTIATGIYGAAFWIFRDRGPPPEAFPPAAALIRQRHQPGDLILLVPFYATRARELLGDLHPIAPRMPLAEDLRKHQRVWVFGLFGEAEALREDAARAGLELLSSHQPSQGITVDLYQVKNPWRVTTDFVEAIERAKVHHEHDGNNEPCQRWDEKNGQGGLHGRWLCPHDSEWFYVAPEWHRMGDHLRLCLWAHPPSSGRLVITFPGVELTGHLFGRGGHTLNASLHAREKIHLDVEVSGQAPQRFDFALDEHWRPFALKTPQGRTGTVAFAVSTPDAGANHFCFEADLRAPPSAEAKK